MHSEAAAWGGGLGTAMTMREKKKRDLSLSTLLGHYKICEE